jgi:carbonic anhydrase/acetyltransferase-like protein (isoleucine patch superfamily)
MRITFNAKSPTIGRNVFIAPTAVLIGDVTVKDGASIWYNTVLRGDMDPIVVGENTNIQDNCTLHTDAGYPCILAANVTVGHNAVVHGCTVESGSLIGIGAVVLNGARIGTESVVAAGSVVREGQEVGPRHLVAGSPATFKRELDDALAARFREPVADYLALSELHRTRLSMDGEGPDGP